MSDTVLLALITAVVTIAAAIIGLVDRQRIRAELSDQLVAQTDELVKHNAS